MKKKIIGISLACSLLISIFSTISVFASTNGFTSDTKNDVTIPKGSNYTLKITPDNPSENIVVNTGNRNVARIIQSTKVDNNYFITIATDGKTSECTGLYVTIDNQQTHLLNITVGYAVNNTGKHLDQIIDKNGKVTEVLNQDKGWQLQIEEKPIHYKADTLWGKNQDQKVTLDASLSEVNTNEKYFIVSYGGYFNDFYNSGLKLITSFGKDLKYEPYDFCRFKVSYNNIDEIKTMYFGTDTEKTTLRMIYFQ